jgi:hypothetical protein
MCRDQDGSKVSRLNRLGDKLGYTPGLLCVASFGGLHDMYDNCAVPERCSTVLEVM